MEPKSRDLFALTGKKRIRPHRLDTQVSRTLLTLSRAQFFAWLIHLEIGSYRPFSRLTYASYKNLLFPSEREFAMPRKK